MDKRNTQLALPLVSREKDNSRLIRQHWELTFARQPKISVVAKRMMNVVLSQIQQDDTDLKPYYEMHVSEVVKDNSGGTAYKQCDKAFQDLSNVAWMIRDLEKKTAIPRHLLDTTKTIEDDGFVTGYQDGRIIISINKALKPYFIQLAHYSKFDLDVNNFTSWYSFRFWEVLSAFQDSGVWNVSLDDYRKIMDCEKKYKDVNAMIRKTTAEPLEELKGTPLEFGEPNKIYSKYSGKGRPPVVGLEFKLVRSLLNDDEILSEWAKHSSEHARMISKLHNDWKITQACLRKYLPKIKMEGARKLLRQFEQMESIGTKRKIDSKEKYCNSAIKKMAEEITKGKKKE